MKKIKKHNTLTDGYIPITLNNAVLPDKLINALYWKFEENGANGERFNMSMAELRSLLGLKSTKEDKRIYEAIKILQTPIQIQQF